MEIHDALQVFENYSIWIIIIGFAIMATLILPRMVANYPFSMPMVILVIGFAAIALPLGLKAPMPQDYGTFTEHITELGVIISLMGAGLSIDRKPDFKSWGSTWRLLIITMPLTILMTSLLGWWAVALAPASAVLLGAAISPTDPVLASEVQVGAPQEGSEKERVKEAEETGSDKEDELRFSLTSEAGLNDGLAFPFTNMAIAMAIAGANPANWIDTWLLINVLYEMVIAVIAGLGLGYVLARFLLNIPAETDMAKAIIGLGALGATLLIYGVTELFGGYGFIATFIAAVMIRNYKPDHEYHKPMHILIEKSQRIFIAGILIALGAAIAGGLLAPLTWELVMVSLAVVFIIRPLSGIIGLIGFKKSPWKERLAISFFGIRGIGSLYYLSYALNEEEFAGSDELWAIMALVIVLSVFIHGFTATPVTNKLDHLRKIGVIN